MKQPFADPRKLPLAGLSLFQNHLARGTIDLGPSFRWHAADVRLSNGGSKASLNSHEARQSPVAALIADFSQPVTTN